ncbi:hypothetical protein PNH38_06215 [Anoxybacillus rupiensis]|uniref:ABC transporter domain-containing protein n=1 Tax=Anoxybacteroides rupiense TaxID=311460 RepID=A0ABD5J1H0_9BACL|nr:MULTISPECIES: hypothetical protein [Anoxybacillus]MBS2772129.1 hypothetical protein [Anoxybacillus rupiensis]MDE8563482.1 hypothetical protein [Anoxybacillus rupiensis]MED5053431.1 hypothetical protein [Anoxybacillus rupiensis]QHC02876.1 hypothetical protein GRQ40_01995 [Anoxybacillus sp. PDR2]
MLELKNVTIKYNRQIILHSCNCKLPSQSIIVAKNNINTDIISRTFAGFHPVDGGEIHLDENVISEKKKLSKKVFFVIPENYNKLWMNYRLQEIPKLMNSSFQQSALCQKYNILPQASIDSLTIFQRLIYIISLGQALNRTIFILNQPTKYFDFEDLEQFYHFLKDDFSDAHYLIFTNRIERIFTMLSKPIYQLDSTKLLRLKGGEEDGCQ